MRFISIRQAAAQARAALARFPLVLLAAAVATVFALQLVNADRADEHLLRPLFAGLLGLPLLTALATTAERAGWSTRIRWLVSLVAVAALLLFWYFSAPWSETIRITRFAQLVVAFHLLAAILPFARTPAHHAFWQYNRILFIRFLMAGLFAAVLFAGLAVALLAIDNLLGVDVDNDWYPRLWVILAFVFHPWFFLGGVPRDLSALEQREDYPGGLKVFAQFILIPVVSVYLLILTAYLVRVLITRTWPSGWIGWLVSSVSTAGTLALLLVHPVRERADSRWVNTYGRWFYVVLLPSIAMLLMAIWQRIEQYGITERRYFLTVLALWLTGIALFYAITGSRNIRVIPTTLCLIALLTFFGPWSAYAVSQRSQANRLRGLLTRNEMLVEGRLQKPPADVPFIDLREISATTRYLVNTHGPAPLGRVSAELRQVAESPPPAEPAAAMDDSVARAVVGRLGITYVNRWESQPQRERYVNWWANAFGSAVSVTGYDVLMRANLLPSFNVPVGADTLSFAYDTAQMALVVAQRADTLARIPLGDLLAQAREASAQPLTTPSPDVQAAPNSRPPLVLDADGRRFRFRFVVYNLSGRDETGERQINAIEADVLIARKPPGS